VESDKERLTQKFKDYLHFERVSDQPAQFKQFLTDCATANSQLGQVPNNVDSVWFMKLLSTFDNYYFHDPIFSVKWIRENIHRATGGVSYTVDMKVVNDELRCLLVVS